MLKKAKVKIITNFTLILTASSPVQKLVWVNTLRWLKFLFQAKSDLPSVVERGLDILCTSKTQVLIDDASDECFRSKAFIAV